MGMPKELAARITMVRFLIALKQQIKKIESGEIVPVLISSNGLPALKAINGLVKLASVTLGSVTADGSGVNDCSRKDLLIALRTKAVIALAEMSDPKAVKEVERLAKEIDERKAQEMRD